MAYTELKSVCYLSMGIKFQQFIKVGKDDCHLPSAHTFAFSLTSSPIHPNNNCLCSFIFCFFAVPLTLCMATVSETEQESSKG